MIDGRGRRPGRFLFPMSNRHMAILSPCIGVCALDADGYCQGCHRTGEEIAAWIGMGDEERRHLLEQVLPEREARRG